MDIIAQDFQTPGNIGALARAMKNFEFANLVLLNPKCNHLDKESLDRATHAKEILKNAKIIKNLDDYDTIIGTTAILGTDFNLQRNPITPEQLSKMTFKGKVGLIIGREGDGMHNEELLKCDIIVTIPTSKKYPTMNVSHAATIILYELFKRSKAEKVGDSIRHATKEDKERIYKLVNETLNKLDFASESKKNTQRLIWKKLIGKSNLTKRELMILYGFLRKIK
ncbi:RNA methyltransferase [Candidatus Woesearchaeota archaeon]|nr:RNA methyltransferase [Candidatus Woesearchaeota archaeon]